MTDKLGVVLFLLVGICILGMSLFSLIRNVRKKSECIRITGTVIGHRKGKIGTIGNFTLNSSYAPRVRFTHDQKERTYTDEVSTCWKRFSTGDSANLLINPKTNEVQIDTFISRHLGTCVMFLIGIVFVWSSIAFLLGWENPIKPS